MLKGSAHTRVKLHGRPLQLANELCRLTEHRGEGYPSIRAWGRRVAEVIRQAARTTNVEAYSFTGYVADWVVNAIQRQRELDFQQACGVR